jgi:hypothetical protein
MWSVRRFVDDRTPAVDLERGSLERIDRVATANTEIADAWFTVIRLGVRHSSSQPIGLRARMHRG